MARNVLNSVKLVRPNSSVFDWTHDHKLSFNMGQLIPVMCEECVPGDRWRVSQESLVRFAPLVTPMMQRCDVYFHTFYVPMRLLWPNFENFITGTKVLGLDPAFPYFKLENVFNRLLDHMGLADPGSETNVDVSAMYAAAYQFIWNEYYRDQNLQTPAVYELGDGDNSGQTDLFVLRNRAWGHDYFTSLLPFAQKGDAVDIPLGTVALKDPWYTGDPDLQTPQFVNTVQVPNAGDVTQTIAPVSGLAGVRINDGGTYAYDPAGTLQVDPTTIKDLRRAFKLQEFLEREAVGGTRYNEWIYSIFGVKTSDASLQRPIYVTGSKSAVQISEVLNTTGTEDLPQGNMAGHGVAVTNGAGASYFCEEPGVMMTIMSVMPKSSYMQGIPRKYLKITDRYQYFIPQFEHIGEQEVARQELNVQSTNRRGVLGYSARYTEYKVPFNYVSGEFKTSLLAWHMAREFDAGASLNAEFIQCFPTFRVFAVTDPAVDHLYVHVLNKVSIRRMMSRYSTPHL